MSASSTPGNVGVMCSSAPATKGTVTEKTGWSLWPAPLLTHRTGTRPENRRPCQLLAQGIVTQGNEKHLLCFHPQDLPHTLWVVLNTKLTVNVEISFEKHSFSLVNVPSVSPYSILKLSAPPKGKANQFMNITFNLFLQFSSIVQ